MIPVQPHQLLEVRIPPATLFRIGKWSIVFRNGLGKIGQRLAYGDGAFSFLPLDERLRDLGKIPLEWKPVTQAEYKDPSTMLRNAKIRSHDRNDGGSRVSGFAEGVEDLGSEMAILHGHHVGDVLHHERARPEKPDDADEFLVEAVARIVQIARSDLAEPLARRPAIDNVDLLGDELVEAGHARLRILQEAGDVALEQRNIIKIGGMRQARLGIRFNGADDLPAARRTPSQNPPAPLKRETAVSVMTPDRQQRIAGRPHSD